MKVLVDGRPVSVEGIGKAPKASGELSVPIPSRDCEVSVIAENRHAVSEPATIRLRWKGMAAVKEIFQIKPKLYVLAVGVSQYQDPDCGWIWPPRTPWTSAPSGTISTGGSTAVWS